ncbi:hypothetical protein GQ457_05G025770 [Hibiscus cannabinus]
MVLYLANACDLLEQGQRSNSDFEQPVDQAIFATNLEASFTEVQIFELALVRIGFWAKCNWSSSTFTILDFYRSPNLCEINPPKKTKFPRGFQNQLEAIREAGIIFLGSKWRYICYLIIQSNSLLDVNWIHGLNQGWPKRVSVKWLTGKWINGREGSLHSDFLGIRPSK